MRILLDTNIIIHREAATIINEDIGELFRWIDKLHYSKCIHPLTIEEINNYEDEKLKKSIIIKLDSYNKLMTVAPIQNKVQELMDNYDKSENDRKDSLIINEVFSDRVDLLITEDKKIHFKATQLGITDKVFSIESFLDKVTEENPDLVDYKVLSIKKEYFGKINLEDSFFQSFKEDYEGFEKWFNGKSDEIAYVCKKHDSIAGFLYVKPEVGNENYSDISPTFTKKRRLKISSFKVNIYGHYLGERFLKIVFDNALRYKVEEIYVTIFDKRPEQLWLIKLLEQWGFIYYGIKNNSYADEKVFVRDFNAKANLDSPKTTFPYISTHSNFFLVSIYPDYHTELFPDSILKTESPDNFVENQPHRNSLSKVFISRSIERDLKSGDIIVFYRTGDRHPKIYTSVVSTIGVVENIIINIIDEQDFIRQCRGRSVFSDKQLIEQWNFKRNYKPFIVNFIYVCSLSKRINLKKLIDLRVISGIDNVPRGFSKITYEQFSLIVKESQTDESIIVH